MRKLIMLTLVVVLVSACAGSDPITIDDPWARTSAAMQNAGAVYMTITSTENDRLMSAAVDESVAVSAMLHETQVTETEDGTEVMTMQGVEAIVIEAGQEVALEPGGYHIMMMDLAEPLVAGTEFEITLTFENAGDVVVTVEVRDG